MMDCSPLAMAFKDPDLKLIPLPPPGTEYERLPSPPPSDHSSQEDKDDKMLDKVNKEKKIRMPPEVYLRIRNRNVINYLNNLRENPPPSCEDYSAKFQKWREKRIMLRKDKVSPQADVVKKDVDDEFGCFSDSSQETNFSFPRIFLKAQQQNLQVQCYKSMVDQRKQQMNGALANGVLFSHVNFQIILEVKWSFIKIKRLELILQGLPLDRTMNPTWVDFEKEIQKSYGPLDTDSMHFKKLLEAFQSQRLEMTSKMFEEEREMMGRILKWKKDPSELIQQLAALKEVRSRLETRIMTMFEFQCDQNPYTNKDNMDFWVMPRPKQTIEVYSIRNKETDKFLEFSLPLYEKGVPQQLDSKTKHRIFLRKGYNTSVFDVGWHYSPIKAFWDIPRKLLSTSSGKSSLSKRDRFDEKMWTSRFLEVRWDLMKFNPFGHELTGFYKLVKNKYQIPKNGAIFSGMVDQSFLTDLFFPQTLLSGGASANKIILFDSHFEGVIVPPVEMLLRIWTRIRFLIEAQPNHLLPLNGFLRIYEDCFGQRFFPIRWGFQDAEDFVQNVRQYFPNGIIEDVTIVTKDERVLKKTDASAVMIETKIDAKWARILANDDDDDEDDDMMTFDIDDLFEDLVHEGPWLREGEVYRVLMD